MSEALEEASLATSSSESCTRKVPESGPWPLIRPLGRPPEHAQLEGSEVYHRLVGPQASELRGFVGHSFLLEPVE